MAQHDYVIDNNNGATVRSDINSLAAAAVSLNSGGSAPSTTYAYMLWADTTAGVLKQRNAANSAWQTLCPLVTRLMHAGTEGTIASATTTDLGSVVANYMQVTGTTTITSFGSSASTDNPLYFLRFSGALQLTHNGTSLVLPTAANITTAAGDFLIALYRGSGNWTVLNYFRASGSALVGGGSIDIVSGTTGTLTVARGGTGATTLAANNVLLGNGTSAPQAVAPGTSGNVLTSNGTTWQSSAPSGAASDRQTFNSSGTWTKPSGYSSTAMALIEAWGGGGAGGHGANGGGASGGNTSFGSIITAYGGAGGDQNVNTTVGGGGAGGYASAGSGRTNDTGFEGFGYNTTAGNSARGGFFTGGGGGGNSQPGGNSIYGGGGGSSSAGSAGTSQFGGNGGGPGSAGTQPGGGGSGVSSAGGGGGGSYKFTFVPLSSLGATETVTIGSGGSGGTSGNAGAAGRVRVTVFG